MRTRSIALAISAVSMFATPAIAGSEPRVISITASQSQFTPDHIELKKDEPVILRLTSTDVAHGLLIRPLGVDADIPPKSTVDVPITAGRAGKFKAICDHYCGTGHGGMKMSIVVE